MSMSFVVRYVLRVIESPYPHRIVEVFMYDQRLAVQHRAFF